MSEPCDLSQVLVSYSKGRPVTINKGNYSPSRKAKVHWSLAIKRLSELEQEFDSFDILKIKPFTNKFWFFGEDFLKSSSACARYRGKPSDSAMQPIRIRKIVGSCRDLQNNRSIPPRN